MNNWARGAGTDSDGQWPMHEMLERTVTSGTEDGSSPTTMLLLGRQRRACVFVAEKVWTGEDNEGHGRGQRQREGNEERRTENVWTSSSRAKATLSREVGIGM